MLNWDMGNENVVFAVVLRSGYQTLRKIGQWLRRILVRLRNGNRKGRRLSFPECPLCASSTYCVPDSLHCKLRAPINLLAQSSSYQPIVQMRPQHTEEAETVESPLAIAS